MHFFSMATPNLNGCISRKRWCVHLKTPEHQRKLLNRHRLCAYLVGYIWWELPVPVQHMQVQNYFVLSWVFQLNFGSFKAVFCFFWAWYFAFAYLWLIYEMWKMYWIPKASKLLNGKRKTNCPDPKPLETEKLCKELSIAWCGCIGGTVFS